MTTGLKDGTERTDGQFEEGIGDLEHKDVRVPVVVDHKDTFDGPPHAKVLIIVFEPLQTCRHRRVFFWLRLLCA
jgi:hypothetical protein